jgi:hypothetical protein
MTGPVVPTVFHLRRARDLIDRHFAEPLDLDAMAGASGFSRYHFARGFREAYGATSPSSSAPRPPSTADGTPSAAPRSARPYGVEAVFRDDSGNWFSLTRPTGSEQ